MSKRFCLWKIHIFGSVKTCFFVEKTKFLGMTKRVVLWKIRICGYVKTCFFVENTDFWVCQNVFVYRKCGFLGMSKRVVLLKKPNASTLWRARASVRDPRVVFAKGARTACGSAGSGQRHKIRTRGKNVTKCYDVL